MSFRDRVHCETEELFSAWGVMYDADINATLNILWRAGDPRITVYTPWEVERIIERRRGGELSHQDTSWEVALLPSSTMSETPTTRVCLGWWGTVQDIR